MCPASSCLPAHPWQRSFCTKGMYLFACSCLFLTVSRGNTVGSTTTSTNVIGALKSVFARHGIPEEVVSDNGPQFVSEEMKEFPYTVWISPLF